MTADPWNPEPGEARREITRELTTGDYQTFSLKDWLLSQLERLFPGSSDGSGEGGGLFGDLAAYVGLAIVVICAVAVVFFLTRLRRTSTLTRTKTPLIGADTDLTTEEILAEAESAYAAGDYDAALTRGYAAAAKHHEELFAHDIQPAQTAHEIAGIIAMRTPERGDAAVTAAGLFDLVAYGHRSATAPQARQVIEFASGVRR